MGHYLKYLIVYLLLAFGVFFAIYKKVYTPNYVEINIELQAEKEDAVEIYFRKENEAFNEVNKLVKTIKGANNLESHQFKIPAFYTYIRLDISRNAEQKTVGSYFPIIL